MARPTPAPRTRPLPAPNTDAAQWGWRATRPSGPHRLQPDPAASPRATGLQTTGPQPGGPQAAGLRANSGGPAAGQRGSRAAGLSAAAALLLCSAAAVAQSTAPAPAGGTRSAPPLWELGLAAAGASQQAYPGADERVQRAVVLPWAVYRGRWLRAEGDTAGLRAMKTDTFELDVGITGAFGAGGSGLAARQGMPALGTLIEFGPRARWRLGDAPGGGRWRLDLPLRGVFDLSDGAAHRGWALEPEIAWERRQGPWRYNVSAALVLGDRQINNTFYGVAPAYATAQRPAYAADAGLIATRLATGFTRSLGPDWRLFGYARIDSVAGAANRNSPLVRQNHGATVGLGLAYTWLRSSRGAAD